MEHFSKNPVFTNSFRYGSAFTQVQIMDAVLCNGADLHGSF